jgi:hypothetical protein
MNHGEKMFGLLGSLGGFVGSLAMIAHHAGRADALCEAAFKSMEKSHGIDRWAHFLTVAARNKCERALMDVVFSAFTGVMFFIALLICIALLHPRAARPNKMNASD